MKRSFLKVILSLTIVFTSLHSIAQFSPADSAYMISFYDHPLYIDSTVTPGNWYHNQPPTSFYNHYLMLDTGFKFNTLDLDSIDLLTINDSLHYDTFINNSFNSNPSLLNQVNPMVYLPFTLNNKPGAAYTIYYPDTNNSFCKTAFLIVPGSGRNQAYDIVRGVGYHNMLCSMKNNSLSFGDVYTLVKPNEESRAFRWNDNKLGSWIFWYTNSANTFYGTNYLIEIIAMVKYLKQKYDKVILFGLSEGGYASILTTFYIQPDAVMISGGYSIGFDTCNDEKDYLRLRFDTLVDYYDRIKVKDKIQNSSTQYLFTWGENDPVLTMDPEHDFHYTEQYFVGLTNCSYFYDFYDHTFPPCSNIDTFVNRILHIPQAHYYITDSTLVDTMYTQVKFCSPGQYQFDLYKDTTFIQTYNIAGDTVNIALTDSGYYYIKNIVDTNMLVGKCIDTIYSNKHPISITTSNLDENINIWTLKIVNPVYDKMDIQIISSNKEDIRIEIQGILGQKMYSKSVTEGRLSIETASWPSGIYIVSVSNSSQTKRLKILKK